MDLSAYRPTMQEEGQYTGPFSTYPEWHAASIGLGVGVLFLVAVLLYPAVAPVVGACYLRIGYYALTGNRLKLGVGRAIDLPRAILGQINEESHYYLVPSSVLVGIGLIVYVG